MRGRSLGGETQHGNQPQARHPSCHRPHLSATPCPPLIRTYLQAKLGEALLPRLSGKKQIVPLIAKTALFKTSSLIRRMSTAIHDNVKPLAFLLGAASATRITVLAVTVDAELSKIRTVLPTGTWKGEGEGVYPTIKSFNYGEEAVFATNGKVSGVPLREGPPRRRYRHEYNTDASVCQRVAPQVSSCFPFPVAPPRHRA